MMISAGLADPRMKIEIEVTAPQASAESPPVPTKAPMDLLPLPALLAAFLAASLVLAVTPGPGVVYIVARTLAQGAARGWRRWPAWRWATWATPSVPRSAGRAVRLVLAGLHRWSVRAGAAYLLFLAWQALRAPARPRPDLPQVEAARQGLHLATASSWRCQPQDDDLLRRLPAAVHRSSPAGRAAEPVSALFVLMAGCTQRLLLAATVALLLRRGSGPPARAVSRPQSGGVPAAGAVRAAVRSASGGGPWRPEDRRAIPIPGHEPEPIRTTSNAPRGDSDGGAPAWRAAKNLRAACATACSRRR